MSEPLLSIPLFQKKRATERLIEESRPTSDFYLMLGASAFITTIGIIVGSMPAIIGGMLVAPLLSPILSLGLGIVTASREVLARAVSVFVKAILVIIFTSLVLAFLLNKGVGSGMIGQFSDPTVYFFLVGLVAGVAASFAWSKSKESAVLPGIAVAVTIVPPLAAVGISLVSGSSTIIAGAVMLFILNLFGILFGSIIVFSLFGFAQFQKEAERKIIEETIEVKGVEEGEQESED